MRLALALPLLAASLATAASLPPPADPPHDQGYGVAPADGDDDITAEQREAIWRGLDTQLKRLALPKAGERPSFIWPLRTARGFSQPAAERISNYVDHDSAFPNRIQDYNCGQRSYDRDTGYNHQGIDISFWPDNWNMMQARQLEIIAAAPGTIVTKTDGNFDQNCVFNTSSWNAVYVQHDDGSIAWYGHMKSGTLTAKAVGARVAAGEFLGSVGSSGSSTGPHLHFEVYDSSRKLIDPYRGACNAWNTDSWWAQQPAYYITRVNRVATASAPPVFSTCGSDGRMATPGTLNPKSDFAAGDTAYFVAYVRDAQAGTAVRFSIKRPDGSVWRSTTSSVATSFSSGAYWWVSYTMAAAEPTGTWTLEASVDASVASVPFTLTASGAGIDHFTDLWWNATEPGWGLNLNHQGETFFATWFTYDTDGSGMWLVMPDAGGTVARKSGNIYRATGVPLAQINGAPAANFPLPAVGTGTFDVVDRNNIRFSYTVNGVSQMKTLQRQAFSTTTRCVESRGSRVHATNYQDLWWNPSESGWGLNLAHQGETIFATWFTYGAGGRGQWLVGSGLQRQPTGEYRGRLYRTSGRAFNLIQGASALVGNPVDVGEATLTFTDGERGRFDYTVDGVTQSKAITRQVFGSSAALCS